MDRAYGVRMSEQTEKLKVFISRLEGRYTDYPSALAACASPLYANGDVRTDEAEYFRLARRARAAAKKPLTATAEARLSPYLQVAERADNRDLRILDVGGTDGRFYHWLRARLGPDAITAYGVLEAPQVAELGKRIAAPPLTFYSDLSEVPKDAYDIIVFGGMLQVMPEPEAFFDAVLAHVAWSHVAVTIFPLLQSQDEDVISAKRPNGSKGYPYRLFGRRWLDKFTGIGDVTHFDMPSYRFALDGRKHRQSGIIISRG